MIYRDTIYIFGIWERLKPVTAQLKPVHILHFAVYILHFIVHNKFIIIIYTRRLGVCHWPEAKCENLFWKFELQQRCQLENWGDLLYLTGLHGTRKQEVGISNSRRLNLPLEWSTLESCGVKKGSAWSWTIDKTTSLVVRRGTRSRSGHLRWLKLDLQHLAGWQDSPPDWLVTSVLHGGIGGCSLPTFYRIDWAHFGETGWDILPRDCRQLAEEVWWPVGEEDSTTSQLVLVRTWNILIEIYSYCQLNYTRLYNRVHILCIY